MTKGKRGRRSSRDVGSQKPVEDEARNSGSDLEECDGESSDGAKRARSRDPNLPEDIGMNRVRQHYIALSKKKKKVQPQKVTKQLLFSSLNPPLEVKGKQFQIDKHLEEKDNLLAHHMEQFERWWWEMENGFSILLQGYGSKSILLDLFASCAAKLNQNSSQRSATSTKRLVDPLVCTVRGWSKSADIRKLVDSLMREWLEWDARRIFSEKRKAGGEWSLEDRCNAIVRDAESSRRCLLLLVHSLDGENLRARSSQEALSCLAACRNVRFIASVDHINAPLMWTRRESKRFNFVAHDATTFVPYTSETRYFSDPQVSAKSVATVSSSKGIAYVMQSLTPTHNSILKEIATRQLNMQSGSTSKKEAGVEFQVLLQHCLDMMWVANSATLQQYMKEFRDHNLVTTKRIDGKEHLLLNASIEIIKREILGIVDVDADAEEES